MIVKVQRCYCGNGKIIHRLLLCGGLRVPFENWNRKAAAYALGLIEIEQIPVKRRNIRFQHV